MYKISKQETYAGTCQHVPIMLDLLKIYRIAVQPEITIVHLKRFGRMLIRIKIRNADNMYLINNFVFKLIINCYKSYLNITQTKDAYTNRPQFEQ